MAKSSEEARPPVHDESDAQFWADQSRKTVVTMIWVFVIGFCLGASAALSIFVAWYYYLR